MMDPSAFNGNSTTSGQVRAQAFTDSQRGSETPTEAIGFYRSKGPEDASGPSLFPPAIDATARNVLLDLTGVDVWLLASVCAPAHYRKKAIWRLHHMRCDVCGQSWDDGIRLARHHKVPERLCLLLGLSRWQARSESNMAVLCEKHHEASDKRVRAAIAEKLPSLYCWKAE